MNKREREPVIKTFFGNVAGITVAGVALVTLVLVAVNACLSPGQTPASVADEVTAFEKDGCTLINAITDNAAASFCATDAELIQLAVDVGVPVADALLDAGSPGPSSSPDGGTLKALSLHPRTCVTLKGQSVCATAPRFQAAIGKALARRTHTL